MHNYIKTRHVLGSGTYGEVTKAYTKNEDGTPGRAVAVKKLFLQKQAVEGLDVTALRDIKFLRELHHPNVIEVRFSKFYFILLFCLSVHFTAIDRDLFMGNNTISMFLCIEIAIRRHLTIKFANFHKT